MSLLQPLDRGFGWNKEFYSFSINKDTQLPEYKIVKLNMFERIGRTVFGMYKDTHTQAFVNAYEHTKALQTCDKILEVNRGCAPGNKDAIDETLNKLNIIKNRHFGAVENQVKLIDQRMDKHVDMNQTVADLISTTRSSRPVDMQGIPGYACVRGSTLTEEGVSADHAAFRELIASVKSPLEQMGAIASGSERTHCAEGAAFQVMQYAMALGETSKYDIDYGESSGSVRSKMTQLAEECKQAPLIHERDWEDGKTPAASLLFYKIVRDDKGNRRVVGFSCGETILMVNQMTSKGVIVTPLAYPHNVNLQRATVPGDFQFFDYKLNPGDVVLAASDGFVKPFVNLHEAGTRFLGEGYNLRNLPEAMNHEIDVGVADRDDYVVQFIQ